MFGFSVTSPELDGPPETGGVDWLWLREAQKGPGFGIYIRGSESLASWSRNKAVSSNRTKKK